MSLDELLNAYLPAALGVALAMTAYRMGGLYLQRSAYGYEPKHVSEPCRLADVRLAELCPCDECRATVARTDRLERETHVGDYADGDPLA